MRRCAPEPPPPRRVRAGATRHGTRACAGSLLALDPLQTRAAALFQQPLDEQLTARDQRFRGAQVRDALLDDALQPLDAGAEGQLRVAVLWREFVHGASSSSTRHGTVPSTTRSWNGAPL